MATFSRANMSTTRNMAFEGILGRTGPRSVEIMSMVRRRTGTNGRMENMNGKYSMRMVSSSLLKCPIGAVRLLEPMPLRDGLVKLRTILVKASRNRTWHLHPFPRRVVRLSRRFQEISREKSGGQRPGG